MYLPDANLYFDMVFAANKSYSEVNIQEPAIIVGIGFKNINEMDSLRMRDDTYPQALPSNEMPVSGGAERFLSFLRKELISLMDTSYRVKTSQRILMGHSIGAYFTMCAWLQTIATHSTQFSGFVAASPSQHYKGHYLLHQFEKQNLSCKQKLNLLVSFGGLEDDEDADETEYIKKRLLNKATQ